MVRSTIDDGRLTIGRSTEWGHAPAMRGFAFLRVRVDHGWVRRRYSRANLAGVLVSPLAVSPGIKSRRPGVHQHGVPYSNRSAPEIRRIRDAFEPKGVRFWLVYPNSAEAPAIIRAHLESVQLPDIALRDVRHELVKLAKPTVNA